MDDIGGVVVTAFEHPGKWQDRTFELAGDELSITELVQVFARASGREVRYVQVPWEEFEKQAGKEMTTMWRWFQEAGYHVDISAECESAAGRTAATTSFNELPRCPAAVDHKRLPGD